jgi:GntR family transcriptional regulator, N-acetylglucosamine utilization regulator
MSPDIERDGEDAASRHKHEVVRAYLLEAMRHRLTPNDQLPTERELAEELGVSRSTVRRALEQMSAEGRVHRVQGAGTFVTERPIRKGATLTSFSEDMRVRGLSPGARLLRADETVAGADLGWRLSVSPAEPLLNIERLRLADDAPMCLENVYFVKRFAPDLLSWDLETSLYDLLAERYRIVVDRAEQWVTATVLDPGDARHLQVPPLSAALRVERVTFDQQGRRVELARSLYRGDRYAFEQTLQRKA